MEYEWDETKRQSNIVKHGVDFTVAHDFEWTSAKTWADSRHHYAETRYVSIAPISMRLYIMVWTLHSNNRRIISLRKANKREVRKYEQAT